MKLILRRNTFREDGVFGELLDEKFNHMFMTLEHAYKQEDGSYEPKVPAGEYLCKRGLHQLHKGDPFDTFEVTGIEGHAGILFHVGNYNKDSEGCILLGTGIGLMLKGGKMLTASTQAFGKFINDMGNEKAFTLVIEKIISIPSEKLTIA